MCGFLYLFFFICQFLPHAPGDDVEVPLDMLWDVLEGDDQDRKLAVPAGFSVDLNEFSEAHCPRSMLGGLGLVPEPLAGHV